MRSFLDCPHNNQQEYTDYCFDCGYNINITTDEYLKSLKDRIQMKTKALSEIDPKIKEIRELEKQLTDLEAKGKGLADN